MNCCCQNPSGGDVPSEGGAHRRRFLAQAITFALGGVAVLTPLAAGVMAFLNPLRQKSRAGEFMRVTSLEVLPTDGTPQKFPIIADRTDAWNRFPSEAIGAVFLRRIGPAEVKALHATCPHAGCVIQFQAAPDGGKFSCPCHSATFDLGGARLEATSNSPRDMDTLDEVEIRNGTEVWVKFQNFATGTSQKTAKA
jgi:Rieske Fe-S protein